MGFYGNLVEWKLSRIYEIDSKEVSKNVGDRLSTDLLESSSEASKTETELHSIELIAKGIPLIPQITLLLPRQ